MARPKKQVSTERHPDFLIPDDLEGRMQYPRGYFQAVNTLAYRQSSPLADVSLVPTVRTCLESDLGHGIPVHPERYYRCLATRTGRSTIAHAHGPIGCSRDSSR